MAAQRAAPAAAGVGEAPAAPAQATGAPEFSGEVHRAAGLPATGTVFIYVRAEGVTAGPPLRVKKLPPVFPLHFEIGAADSPMGGTLPDGKVQLSVRLDADGNVMTKTPADPVAISAPIEAGATGIRLELAAPAP